ncbi:helix-turn-helix domain-containing protein [Nonomuraea basaltis]|uniref:helix-turn-helix domain-containing protein n=1 Tax=Nonomuraea basaltis TaxID=2495887 RepID=UPI001981D172|nr:hypothetical protein [Nonomuraea basaltis]
MWTGVAGGGGILGMYLSAVLVDLASWRWLFVLPVVLVVVAIVMALRSTREFGTALGVALLGAVLTAGHRGAIDSRLDGVPDDAADTAREGVANALAAADGVGPQAQALTRAAQESFVSIQAKAIRFSTLDRICHVLGCRARRLDHRRPAR